MSGVVAITTSGEDSCALTSGGGVKCSGGNNPIGDWPDRHNSRPAPVDVGAFSSAVTALAGGDLIELCALTAAGAVQCWGGWDGPGRVVPSFASGVAAISIGGWYSGRICAVTTVGALACEGGSGPANAPSSGVKAVSVGATGGVCYLTTAGEAFCAGAHGGGGQDALLRPVAGITGATAIAVAGSNACAIVAGGTIKCWGYNSYGALGCGCTSMSYAPPTAVAVPSSPGGGTSGGTTSGCSLASANAAVARYRLGDEGVANPVFKVVCGSFTGAGSRTMVASLRGPGTSGMIAWVVFRWSGGGWTFLLKQHRAAQLSAAGADIRETVSVYRTGDARCCPSGGTKSRLWHWNGARLVAAPAPGK